MTILHLGGVLFPMTIRFLRIFTFFMCAFTTGIVNARTLHVGNKTFALSQTKYTTPSLAFGIGNEVWYAPLAPIFINESLHFRYKNIPFSVDVPDDYPDLLTEYNCPQIFTDTENYTYDENGRLIGADENLWLKNTKTNTIRTDFYASPKSRAELIMRWDEDYNETGTWFFGHSKPDKSSGFTFSINWNKTRGYNHRLQPWLCAYQSSGCTYKYRDTTPANIKFTKQTYILDAKNRKFSIGTQTITGLSRPSSDTTFRPLVLFGYSNPTYANVPYNNYIYMYEAKLYEDDVLMRHFVPVPACMRIGDFIVPENGMWDIVEQKFYGNSGTGSFIYGKDE